MEQRDFSNLSEPPRSVPLSLRLFSIFGREFLAGLFILNFMLIFINVSFGRDTQFSDMLFFKIMTSLFVVIGGWFVVFGIYKGLVRIAKYKRARVALASLRERTERTESSGDSSTHIERFVFEYKANGAVYKLVKEFKNETTKLIADEAFEPVLYIEAEPEKGELLDEVHARIFVDEQGVFRLSFPLQGYIYFILDTLMLVFFIFGILWIFGKIELVNGMIRFL